MNQLQAFLVALLTSKYSKLFTGIVGTVATLYWLPQIIQKGHPVVAQDIGMLVTGATALFAFLQSSAIPSVNTAAVVQQAKTEAKTEAKRASKPPAASPPPLPVLCVFMLAGLVSSCTAQQAKSADTVVVDLTNAICSPADPLDTNPIVAVVCTIAQADEAVAPTIATLTLKMPKAQVPGFVAAHSHATSDANITVTVTEAGKQ
jgi:hypothetical protein